MKYETKEIEFSSIREMPQSERPREKLLAKGAESLSDVELLCVILGNGVPGMPVHGISQLVLRNIATGNSLTLDSLKGIDGLGTAKITQLLAAVEFGRRIGGSVRRKLRDSTDVYDLIRHYGDRRQEHFLAITLNGAMEVLHTQVVTVGLVNRTLVHPREVFVEAIKHFGTSVVLAHNHPSGNLEPSTEDLELTERLRRSGQILGIEVMDHIIFTDENYYSMREGGDFWV